MEEENTRFGLALQAIRSAGEGILAVSREGRDDQVVRYAEQVRRRHIGLILHATPISAARPLGKYLFGENTVICTSATLSTGGTFDLFRARCGIEQPPLELIGSPVFAFEEQAILYIPKLPSYDWQNREAFFQAVAQETKRLLEVSRGRAFCLFTSWAGMQYVSDQLRSDLPWPVLVQGELPRPELLRQFRNTPHSVLFGTKSFWQGVDMPGDALSLVIIDKLPFPSPRDPLHQARTQRITEEGGNAFVEYTLPQMILALKQGFGRLIRTKTDRGIVAVLDNRLTTKRYGSLVINSLPPAKVSRRFSDIYRFYAYAPFDADYALTTWVSAANGACEFRWQLTRLLDGRTKEGIGVADTPQQARWQGTLVGVEQLQSAIAQGGRQADQFKLEIRLPGIAGNAARILGDGQPGLQDRLSMFRAVHAYTLEDGSRL
jgi:ATP-dependent DNA helicase DinG